MGVSARRRKSCNGAVRRGVLAERMCVGERLGLLRLRRVGIAGSDGIGVVDVELGLQERPLSRVGEWSRVVNGQESHLSSSAVLSQDQVLNARLVRIAEMGPQVKCAT